jgi:hypothetical protein
MALGLIARAERRAGKVRDAVGGALSKGSSKTAFNLAVSSLQGELAKLADHRPADAALTYAELAGSIAATAAQIHGHKPRRPAGCPAVPGPDHLIAAFNSTYAPGEDWS